MNRVLLATSTCAATLLFCSATVSVGQSNKASATADTDAKDFGKSYAILRPPQKKLVNDFVARYNQTTGSNLLAEQAYDGARLSIRTTFDAVTHALLMAKMTDENGKSLGPAIDLVEAVDEVMGEQSGVGGDRQFRIYVYLKPNAVATFKKSNEFFRDRDNSIYHKGFPFSYRLKNGPPSIQFSISRDYRMADIDVDYRAEGFPKVLYSGHLTVANSDVRAGNNLQRHDQRWTGLNGWWREVFGPLGNKAKPEKETATESLGHIPLNPALKAGDGVDKSAHDFLNSWVVEKRPNLSAAYFSRRSYACLESIAQKNRKPVPPGMVRLRTVMAMEKYAEEIGSVEAVSSVFEPAKAISEELKEGKNNFASEFKMVSLPTDIGQDQECVPPVEENNKKSKDKYFATAFREKSANGKKKAMTLLWAQEGGYWKIVAIRLEDSDDSGMVPSKAAAKELVEETPKTITADPKSLEAVTGFYRKWLVNRKVNEVSAYLSARSYACLAAPASADKNLKPEARIAQALTRALDRIPAGTKLDGMLSATQPVNEFLRPVQQENSKAFAMMAVPDQMANSFLCQNRQRPEETPELKLSDAKYGNYYLSAARLNFGDEESPALLLLWAKEKSDWKIVAWAVEQP